VRAARDATAAERALDRLRATAAGDENLMEPLIACARALCTEGEIVRTLGETFGEYVEQPRF